MSPRPASQRTAEAVKAKNPQAPFAGKLAGQHLIRAYSLTSEDDADRVPGFRVRTVEEKIDAGDAPIDEARGFENYFRFSRMTRIP